MNTILNDGALASIARARPDRLAPGTHSVKQLGPKRWAVVLWQPWGAPMDYISVSRHTTQGWADNALAILLMPSLPEGWWREGGS